MTRRILVLGPPGSGKSTVARALGAQFGVPVFHLDQAFWRPGWVPAPVAGFMAEVERIARLENWVIDGNYTDTIECRLARADLVIYLDAPSWLSMARVVRRLLTGLGQIGEDNSPGCPERWNFDFLHFTWTWNRARRARTLAMLERFSGRKLIVPARFELDQLITLLK